MGKANNIMDRVAAILNHERTKTAWVCKAVVGEDGKPRIDRFARIMVQYPRDGAGRILVAVSDWSGGSAVHHVGSASGCGYDKRVAAMVGATIGGFELGDHCDSKGRPILRDLARREGWEIIGGDVG